jgi:hypothetical protein
MSRKAQKLFYAVVLSISLLAGVFAAAPQPAVAGGGGGGGTIGILSVRILK